MMEHYQAGGTKPSHFRTPRVWSDASFSTEYPSVRFKRGRQRLTAWLGWIAAGAVTVLYLASKAA